MSRDNSPRVKESRDSSPRSEGEAQSMASGFEFKDDRDGPYVRCKDRHGIWRTIWKLSQIPGFDRSKLLQDNLEGSIYMYQAAAMEWTEFFLQKNLKLEGDLDCANRLKDVKDGAIVIAADNYFPYFQMEDRTVKGVHKGHLGGNVHLNRVHLSSSGSEITLSANVLYFIAGDDDIDHLIPKRCPVCMGEHDIQHTPCIQVLNFVSTDHSRIPPDRIKICDMGAPILTIYSDGQSVLRAASLYKEICDDCVQQARRVGNVWLRLNRSCEDRECINYFSCACVDDTINCSDYVFIEQCTHNNLPSNDIAAAIEDGTVQVLRGARLTELTMMYFRSDVKRVVRRALRAGEKMSISDLAASFRTSEEVILTLAMYDRRFADYIDGNKCFTLSIVNGFVENPGPRAVGPWLTGRIVEDSRGQTWHLPQGQPVVVETKDGLSHIKRSGYGTFRKSDELGQYVAGVERSSIYGDKCL